MIILGIDPGARITGYGIIEYSNESMTALEQGCIRIPIADKFAQKLKKIYDGIINIITLYHPDEVTIESVFFGLNVQSALKIGHARGVAILAAANKDLSITEYSPKEIKLAVVGNGNASKEQVQYMVANLLNLNNVPSPNDIADAFAVAICHLHRISTTKKRIQSWSQYVKEHPEKVK